MYEVIIGLVYIAINAYLLFRLLRFLKTLHPFFNKPAFKIVLSVIFAAATLAIAYAGWMPQGTAKRVFRLAGNYWVGIIAYFGIAMLVVDIIFFAAKLFNAKPKLTAPKPRRIISLVAALTALTVIVCGTVNAADIRVTEYSVTAEKSSTLKSLNVVMAADLHMGYNIGCAQIQQMAEKINAQNPDIVILAGDLFDNELGSLEDPDRLSEILRSIKSKYGTYAVLGNHDVNEKVVMGFSAVAGSDFESDTAMDDWIKNAGITLLQDESICIDNAFWLVGRVDHLRADVGITERKSAEQLLAPLDRTKPIIAVDHQPSDTDALAAAGADVILSGHTHNGQTFPLTILTDLYWENPYGRLNKGNTTQIVTSGVGLFGPFMRVGTIPEICKITINFS